LKRPFRLIGYVVFLVATVLVAGLIVLIFGRTDKTVEALGIVEPASYVSVKPQVDGIIDKILVRESDIVNKGDTLAILEADELRFQVEKAKQTLAQAEADLFQLKEEYQNLILSRSFETQSVFANLFQAKRQEEIAKEKYDRAQKLFKDHLVSAEEMEDVKLNYELSQANYTALQERAGLLERRYTLQMREKEKAVLLGKREYELAMGRLGKSVITAPITGGILTPKVEGLVGEKASEGQAILEIGDLSQMNFIAEVDETALPQIKPGQEVRVFVNAFPHRKYGIFQGKVVSISPKPKLTDRGIFFEAKIGIKDPWVKVRSGVGSAAIALKPGLSGKAKIVTEHSVRLIQIVFGEKG
jgi:multidrug resistance efflux pump